MNHSIMSYLITLAPFIGLVFWALLLYFFYRLFKVLIKFEKYLDKKLEQNE